MKREIEKSDKRIREVLIQEYYTKEEGIVYWNWRFQDGKWNKVKSPHKEIPLIKLNTPNN